MATADTTPDDRTDDERTKPPFLRRVRIRGYKSIGFCDVELKPLTVLVGRNAAGKSNFLDALAFVRDMFSLNVQEAVKSRGGWQRVRNRIADSNSIQFEFHVGFSSLAPEADRDDTIDPSSSGGNPHSQPNVQMNLLAAYFIAVSVTSRGIPFILRESLKLQAEGTRHGSGFDSLVSLHSSPDDRPQLSGYSDQPHLDLADGLRWLGCYNFQPEAIRRLQQPAPGTLLERDGRNVASVLAGLREIDPDSVERINGYLSAIVDEVERFDVVRYGEFETVRFQMKSGGSGGEPLAFDAASMSDGTLRALAALVAAFQIHLPTGPSVVGIEEPETALHPAAMRALVDALDEATGRTQIILTTHSADLLEAPDLDASQVLVVRNSKGQTRITPVDAASREIIRKELSTLADLQRMDQLDLDKDDLQRQAELQNGHQGG